MTPAQIATFLISIWSSYLQVLGVPSGNHTCTGITKIPVTVLVNVTVPVTFRSYTWCLRVPPRCSKYTTQLRDRVQLHTEMHNKTITVCCRGYVEMDGRCVPACPEGADCPFMHCNRTNHCQCTPGYQGLYCNDPCPRGVWGKDCKRPCDCPTGYTCHHLTGDCFVDDRPARKTTTTTTTTTKPTTTTPPITTEGTTLETVKTPQFRFPPPPWVEAPTTTARKLTTRVSKEDTASPTTLNMQQTLIQMTSPSTSPPSTLQTARPPIFEFFTPPVTTPTPAFTEIVIEPRPSISQTQTTQEATSTTTKATSTTTPASTHARHRPILFPVLETTQNTITFTQTTNLATTSAPTTSTSEPTTELTTASSTTTSTPTTSPPMYTTKEITPASPIETTLPTIEVPNLLQTKPLEPPYIPITETTKIIPLKEVIEEKTTVIPEFKVIKVIKTDQSPAKVHKLPIPKYQTPPDQLSTTKQLPKNQSSALIPISIDPVGTNFKTTIQQHSQSKAKKEGSPIIYISPTFKEKTSDIGTTTSGPPSKGTKKTAIHIFNLPKELTTAEKPTGNIVDNQVNTKQFHFTEDKTISPTNITFFTTPTTQSTEYRNGSILHTDMSNSGILKHSELSPIAMTMPDMQEKTYESSTIITLKTVDVQETTQMTKKKNKDIVTKKFDDKALKKVSQYRTTTSTLSPIHLLKQLLNATSKPRRTTAVQEPTFDWEFEGYQEKVPVLQVEENEEMDYKKSKFDDLIVLSSDKGRKKQEKVKQSKHSKELKDSKSEKQGNIPTVPPITLILTSTTEVMNKNIIPDNENLKINISTKGYNNEGNENNFSLVKPEDPTFQATTHLPNNIWAALDPQVNNPSGTTNSNDHLIQIEENQQIKQKSIVNEITEANGLVESNTIDTLHTSYETEIRKGSLQQQEDVNYPLINNKMKLVKTEQAYSESAYPAYTAMMVTLAIAVVTLIALTGTLWLYLKRRRERPPMRPYIMAYELPEPPPFDIQDLEHNFFCPTFTNNYAEKINRELLELNYDHPSRSQPEPLYAEVRY